MRTLTSPVLTFAYGTLLPVGIVVTGTFIAFATTPRSGPGPTIATFVLTAAFAVFISLKVYTVRLDGDAIVISWYFKSVRVPFDQVVSVHQQAGAPSGRYSGDHRSRSILITLEESTFFGNVISVPVAPTLLPHNEDHPLVQELSTIFSAARARRAQAG